MAVSVMKVNWSQPSGFLTSLLVHDINNCGKDSCNKEKKRATKITQTKGILRIIKNLFKMMLFLHEQLMNECVPKLKAV